MVSNKLPDIDKSSYSQFSNTALSNPRLDETPDKGWANISWQ
jgi:hypothetical protein